MSGKVTLWTIYRGGFFSYEATEAETQFIIATNRVYPVIIPKITGDGDGVMDSAGVYLSLSKDKVLRAYAERGDKNIQRLEDELTEAKHKRQQLDLLNPGE